ncbi:Outer membrane protein OmpA [Pricia antarctica]|uniref:Outer membrane protein OmpA n=1 Tax=Pricia antarctica TaxID=641691 RepID=A0A1G7IMP6_9FLAO|nr:OmpA family protein [Pricia antarctica]SDF13579.1 Outer membrane protein OmpA [Pricia antarctica]
MNNLNRFLTIATTVFCLFAFAPCAQGQFLKKLGKVAERAAERTVERRVDKEATEKTDQGLDDILEPGSKENDKSEEKGKTGNPVPNEDGRGTPPNDVPENGTGKSSTNTSGSSESDSPKSLSIYSKFDFVPGDDLIFFDDFSNDFVGDFPSQWDTNGNGEVVSVGDSSGKWFEMKSSSSYYPNVADLPVDYTIEFDLLTQGIDKPGTGSAKLFINLTSDNVYGKSHTDKNAIRVSLPLYKLSPRDIEVWNQINGENTISNNITSDLVKVMRQQPHISMAVNGQRFRLWINETKYLDLPSLVPADMLDHLRFDVVGLRDQQDRVFIKNLKVAGGGVDLRRKLMAEGKVSTNAILFDSGSATLQPSSMGVIRQIYQVLQQETAMKLKIVGHTDADGDPTNNVDLSKKRAEAVKNTLISVYQISGDRLQTDGKGESEPIGDNANANGKAQNRRVEFIKL